MNSDNYSYLLSIYENLDSLPPLQPSLPIPPVPSPPLPTAAPLRADRRREVVMTRLAGGHGRNGDWDEATRSRKNLFEGYKTEISKA